MLEYARYIEQDLHWLMQQPQSPERDHIERVLKSQIVKRDAGRCKCGSLKTEAITEHYNACKMCHRAWRAEQ